MQSKADFKHVIVNGRRRNLFRPRLFYPPFNKVCLARRCLGDALCHCRYSNSVHNATIGHKPGGASWPKTWRPVGHPAFVSLLDAFRLCHARAPDGVGQALTGCTVQGRGFGEPLCGWLTSDTGAQMARWAISRSARNDFLVHSSGHRQQGS